MLSVVLTNKNYLAILPKACMMVHNEQENGQQKEFSRAVIDGDAQQEAEPGTAPRDCEASSASEMGSGSGSVYFIRSPDREFVKIGYTGLPVMVRCKQIGASQPGLEVLGYIPGTRDTEAWLHHKFAELRTKGEWFALTTGVRLFLQNLGLIPVPDLKPFVRPQPAMKAVSKRIRKAQLSHIHCEPTMISIVMAQLGQRGGAAKNAAMSPGQRRESAKKAANSRWARVNETTAAPLPETEIMESTGQTKKGNV